MQLWFRAGNVINFSSMGNGMKGLEYMTRSNLQMKSFDFSPLSFLSFLLAFAFEVLGFLINRFLINKNECISTLEQVSRNTPHDVLINNLIKD